MSKTTENKRVNFTTISTTVTSAALGMCTGGGNTVGGMSIGTSSVAAPSRFGTEFSAESDHANAIGTTAGTSTIDRKALKTIRLSLELFQTDSNTYPEFNFSKLTLLEKKKQKKLKQKTNGIQSDPFGDNDDDVARIAKELEKKYGTDYGSSRGRKKSDYCDIGMGYDESDSFIDNTEAYDEVVPDEVETIEGGFYINCGALEFKKLHTEPAVKTVTDEIIKMPNRSKKRVIESSSEESSDDGESSVENKESTEESTTKSIKIKSNNVAIEKRLKTTSNATTTTTATTATTTTATATTTAATTTATTIIIKKPPKNKKKEKPSPSGSSSNSPKPIVDEMGSDSDKDRIRQKTIKTTTVKDMLKAKRDNFLKMQVVVGGIEVKTTNGELKVTPSKSSNDDDSSSSDSDDSDDSESSDNKQDENSKKEIAKIDKQSEKYRSNDTKLPELDSEVIANVQEFKIIAKAKNMLGKKFQFDEKNTELFLKIDEALSCLDKSQRNMVFAHLEFNLLLPKYYFLRKGKQLRIKEEKNKIKRALNKLRKVVIETMPGAISNYETELRKYAELQTGIVDTEHPPKMPKKKFPWNMNLRNLLYEVYQVRWTSFPFLGARKESLETFINSFMKDKVIDIWPSGWMRTEELLKEIDKRKTAIKKAKEREKEKERKKLNSGSSTPTSTAPGNSTPNMNPVVTITPVAPLNKQIDEMPTGSRSLANSDTDSVASNGTINGPKRKNADYANKQKNKAPKLNIEQQQANINNKKQSQILNQHQQQQLQQQQNKLQQHNIQQKLQQQLQQQISMQQSAVTASGSLDLTSPSKRTDHSIQHLIAASLANSSIPLSTTITAANNQVQQHGQQKHSSTAAHVIDLDKCKTANDILQTTNQLMNSAALSAASIMKVPTAKCKTERRESSSESDGVEIVSVYTVKSTENTGYNRQNAKKLYSLPKNMTYFNNTQTPLPNISVSSTAPKAFIYNNNNNKNSKMSDNNAEVEFNKLMQSFKNVEPQSLQKKLSPLRANVATKDKNQ